MGVDIHLSIIHNGEVIKKEIFDGRNSEWFGNLQGEGWDEVYNELYRFYIGYGFPEDAPEDFAKHYEDRYYYGHHYVKVGDFIEWFNKYRPDKDAGWVSTYDKWRIENKSYIPEDLPHSMPTEGRVEDWHFIEYENVYDCSRWLVEYIIDNKIPLEATIFYCFDH